MLISSLVLLVFVPFCRNLLLWGHTSPQRCLAQIGQSGKVKINQIFNLQSKMHQELVINSKELIFICLNIQKNLFTSFSSLNGYLKMLKYYFFY